MSAVYSPDGKRILTSSTDRTAKVWDAQTGQELIPLSGHDSGYGRGPIVQMGSGL